MPFYSQPIKMGMNQIQAMDDGTKDYDAINKRQLDASQRASASIKTGNYALTTANVNQTIEMNVAGANTVTIPNDPLFIVGSKIEVTQIGAGQTQIVAGANVTLQSYLARTKLLGQFAHAYLEKRSTGATDIWLLYGDITV